MKLDLTSGSRYDISKLDMSATGTARVKTDSTLHDTIYFSFVHSMKYLKGKTILIRYDEEYCESTGSFRGRDINDAKAPWWHWDINWLEDISLPIPQRLDEEE